MSKVQYNVQFKGRATIEFDTEDPRYAHYFKEGSRRGGEEGLARDIFFDNAVFDYCDHFEDGSTEIGPGVYLDKIDG